MYLNEGVAGSGNRIVERYAVQEMEKPRQFMKPGIYYGYGLETKQVGDRAVYEHGGSLPGVSSNFSFCPQEEVGIVVLCNTMDVSVAAIADAALNAYCGLEVEEERQIHAERSWSAEELEELAGSYVSGEGDAFTLTVENGTLSMKVNGNPTALQAVYPWQGMVRKTYSDIYLTAIRDEEGHVFAARYGSRIFPEGSIIILKRDSCFSKTGISLLKNTIYNKQCFHRKRRRSSLVEHQLPKAEEAGSIPVACFLKTRVATRFFVFSGIHLRIHGVLAGSIASMVFAKELIQLPSQAFGTGADDVAGSSLQQNFLSLNFFSLSWKPPYPCCFWMGACVLRLRSDRSAHLRRTAPSPSHGPALHRSRCRSHGEQMAWIMSSPTPPVFNSSGAFCAVLLRVKLKINIVEQSADSPEILLISITKLPRVPAHDAFYGETVQNVERLLVVGFQ